ncbi:MAG: funZ protein, partial [bacterium]
MLLARDIQPKELDHNPFSKSGRLKALSTAVDEYYHGAFSPEILCALELVENSKIAAELVAKNLKLSGEEGGSLTSKESRFQVNLLYIEQQFERAIQDLKLRTNHILFIDGIDIRPHGIEYKDYLDCIKGLANAMWGLNNDFFPRIKDS